jgi:hypothetical protein
MISPNINSVTYLLDDTTSAKEGPWLRSSVTFKDRFEGDGDVDFLGVQASASELHSPDVERATLLT